MRADYEELDGMGQSCQQCGQEEVHEPSCPCLDDDDAEGERRFTLPINPDPITSRLRPRRA